MKDGLNNLSAGGGVHQVGGPSLYDMNQVTTNQQMYQSFVRGTLNKKRQSQFSERRAAREKNLEHTKALRDLAAQQQNQQVAHEMLGSGPVIMGAGAQLANTTGKNSGNFFGLAKNQNAMLKNMQLNQPSVMKNSTGAVGGMLSKATVN